MNAEELRKKRMQTAPDGSPLEREKTALEVEIAALKKQRDDLGRFLEIDKEQTALATLIARQAEVVAQGERDAAALREAAKVDAKHLLAEAAHRTDLDRKSILAEAKHEADEIIREARRTAAALQSSAEEVYARAKHHAATVEEELAERRRRVADLERRAGKRE